MRWLFKFSALFSALSSEVLEDGVDRATVAISISYAMIPVCFPVREYRRARNV